MKPAPTQAKSVLKQCLRVGMIAYSGFAFGVDFNLGLYEYDFQTEKQSEYVNLKFDLMEYTANDGLYQAGMHYKFNDYIIVHGGLESAGDHVYWGVSLEYEDLGITWQGKDYITIYTKVFPWKDDL